MIWDDEAGTLTLLSLPEPAHRFSRDVFNGYAALVDRAREFGRLIDHVLDDDNLFLVLDDAAHDPADFLALITAWGDILPPSLQGIEPTRARSFKSWNDLPLGLIWYEPKGEWVSTADLYDITV